MNDDDEIKGSARFPPSLVEPLFTPYSYRILHGGRGGGKSWATARYLIIRGYQQPTRILCAREFMSSVADSVHKLLTDQIYALDEEMFQSPIFQEHYTIEKSGIYGKNGTEFRFAGIRNNVTAIKSFEGIDVCWVEEAQNVSKSSWETLIPTVRKDGSQIIVTFNPYLATDETYKRFILNPPPNSKVVKINFDGNPWFPEKLKMEMEFLKRTDPDAYQNVYLGEPKQFLDNAIYGKEIRLAQEEKRFTSVPYDPAVQVHTFFDLGWRDETAVIFTQVIQGEYHIIDYLHGSGLTTRDVVKMMQAKPYVYGTHWLPHDGNAISAQSGKSYADIMRSLGCKVQIVPNMKIPQGINAARLAFSRLWIDDKKCADFIDCLRKYCYEQSGLKLGDDPDKNPNAKWEPKHNDASHAADAFRYMAICLRGPKSRPVMPHVHVQPRETGWMA